MARLSDRMGGGSSTSGSTGGSYGNSGGNSFSSGHNRRPRRRRRNNNTPGLTGGNGKAAPAQAADDAEADVNPFNDPENAFESISGFLEDFGVGRPDQRTSLQNTWLNKTISDAIDEFNGLTLQPGSNYQGVPGDELTLSQWLPGKWGVHPARVLNDLWNRSTATERGVVPSQFRSSGRVIAY